MKTEDELKDYGIIRRGTFNCTGGLEDWHIDGSKMSPINAYVCKDRQIIEIFRNTVFLCGIYNSELTKERLIAMGLI
jgi:hypothetical protein